MSSTFWFLIDIEGLDESSSDAKFRNHGYDLLLGCDDNGNEENQDKDVWALLLPSGRIVPNLTPPNRIVEQLQAAPASDRWELALQLATQGAATACDIRISPGDHRTMTNELLTAVPRLLSKSYADLAEGKRSASDPLVVDLRQSRLRLCEGLHRIVNKGGLLPFVGPTAPAKGIQAIDRRCLRRSAVEDTALVYAEIHP